MMYTYKITMFLGSQSFSTECGTIAEAYEAVKAIIKFNSVSYPNAEEVLSEYMCALSEMKSGKSYRHSNSHFSIEALKPEPQTERSTP